MVFALNIVQPAPNTEQTLLRSNVMLGFGSVDETDSMKQLYAIRFALQRSRRKFSISKQDDKQIILGLELAYSLPTLSHILILVGYTRSAFSEYR
jgi:hypothetical protein